MKKLSHVFFVLVVSNLMIGESYGYPDNPAKYIHIDQFGYKPTDKKLAVISDPVSGYNAGTPRLTPVPGALYEVRSTVTNTRVFPVAAPGSATVWNSGATHTQSGDKVKWFDFTGLTTPGRYYVYDVNNFKSSEEFSIGVDVYKAPLKAAMRTFFYQRASFAKSTPYAEGSWVDGASHNQDTYATLYNNIDNTTTAPYTYTVNNVPSNPQTDPSKKDLSGGWYDAGDYNKYVNFVWEPVLDLLLAYQDKPTFWQPSNMTWNIPESSNALPDILDEVKYELNWLLKMQQHSTTDPNINGSVLSLVGTRCYDTASPPSQDHAIRQYGRATTQATYAAAGMFGLAAKVFQPLDTTYSNTLKQAAIDAWNWAEAHPGVRFYNSINRQGSYTSQSGSVYSNNINLAAGDQEGSVAEALAGNHWTSDGKTNEKRYVAAIYLYALTGLQSPYGNFVVWNWNNGTTQPFRPLNKKQANVNNATENNALLYYANLTGTIAADPTMAADIKAQYINFINVRNNSNNIILADFFPSIGSSVADPYNAYLFDWGYSWGSNLRKSFQAIQFLNMPSYSLDTTNSSNYTNAASGYLHYLHGVNPLDVTYLTNMSAPANGQAANSVRSLYHAWFNEGTQWDEFGVDNGPAPGFVVMGPNYDYINSINSCCLSSPKTCGTSNGVDQNQFCPNQGQTLPSTPSQNPLVSPQQPPQKTWRDKYNRAYPTASYALNENQIFMQAAYVRLLSRFAN